MFKLYIISLFLILGTTVCLPIADEIILEGNEIDDADEIIADEKPWDKNDIIDLSHFGRSIFGKPDNETTGTAVDSYDPNKQQNVNPEELGSYLEGDILVPSGPGRNGLIAQSTRWPGGIIPYEIRGTFTSQERANIERGINEYHAKTCIRFTPRKNEKDYVSVVSGRSGCWSSIGRIGGKQELNLQSPGCTVKHGTFMHEMMHALGFLHEQNRHERDSYIAIQWQNIQAGVTHNFDKASSSSTYAFGVPYDYGSIMHYSAYAFSNNGQPTILPKQSASGMGQRVALSSKDLQKINTMYNCAVSKNPKPGRPVQSNPFYNFIGGLFGGRQDQGLKKISETNQTETIET